MDKALNILENTPIYGGKVRVEKDDPNADYNRNPSLYHQRYERREDHPPRGSQGVAGSGSFHRDSNHGRENNQNRGMIRPNSFDHRENNRDESFQKFVPRDGRVDDRPYERDSYRSFPPGYDQQRYQPAQNRYEQRPFDERSRGSYK